MSAAKKTQYWMIGLLVTLVIAVVAGCAYFWSKDAETPEVDTRQYVVGVLFDYKPFSYLDENGQRVGFDIDVAQAMCEHMQITCRIVPMPYNQLLDGVRAKQIDILVAGSWATEERKSILSFSDTYYRSRHFFITSLHNVHDVTPENAYQLVIGTIEGTFFQKALERDYKPYGAKIRPYLTYAALIKGIQNGEVNTILLNGLPGYALLRSPEGRNLYIAGWYNQLPVELTESKIAVRNDVKYLVPKINDFILHIQAAGRYQELSLKYFPFMNY